MLDSQENTLTLVGGEDNEIYEHKDIFYAEDHNATSVSSAMIQKSKFSICLLQSVGSVALSEEDPADDSGISGLSLSRGSTVQYSVFRR